MVTVSDKIILIVLIKTSNSHRNINKQKATQCILHLNLSIVLKEGKILKVSRMRNYIFKRIMKLYLRENY